MLTLNIINRIPPTVTALNLPKNNTTPLYLNILPTIQQSTPVLTTTQQTTPVLTTPDKINIVAKNRRVKYTLETFLERARNVHCEKYDY